MMSDASGAYLEQRSSFSKSGRPYCEATAVEDALVLAKCLRDIPEIEGALAMYERLRRRRVEKIVAQGRRNGTGKTPGGPLVNTGDAQTSAATFVA